MKSYIKKARTTFVQKRAKTAWIMAISLLMVGTCNTACTDWLDVQGENISKESEQFTNEQGFKDALIGCYMSMAGTDSYGQRLTMTDVEYMANMWHCQDDYKTSIPEKYELTNHLYAEEHARAAIKSIYAALFNTIAQANVLIANLEKQNLDNNSTLKLVMGEALAIKAYCQFDVLRLFGQLPRGAKKKVLLPWSNTTGIDQMPRYYSFEAYTELLENTLEKAENYLREADPLMNNTFAKLNTPDNAVLDDFGYYRQSRLNYAAVRALQARVALYLGKTYEANRLAMEIIEARTNTGEPVIQLSGADDFAKGYNALPSECLFYLSKFNVAEYANQLLIGGNNRQVHDDDCFVTPTELTQLYASLPGASASHNRYNNLWNRAATNVYGKEAPTLKKYWWDTQAAKNNDLATKYQIIPMLRLSEVYLIAMETTTDLAVANKLYAQYAQACSYALAKPFDTLEALRAELLNEYRREFYAEGQMFYTYKRLAATKMLWNDDTLEEENYIVPLPSTEYNPDATTQK